MASRYASAVLIALVAASFNLTVHAQMVMPLGSTMTVPGMALDLACTDLLVQGTLNVGSAQINQSATVGIASAGQLNAGSGTITLGGDWNNTGAFNAGTSTVVLSDACGNAQAQLTGTTTFYNLTLSSSLGKKFMFPRRDEHHSDWHAEIARRTRQSDSTPIAFWTANHY